MKSCSTNDVKVYNLNAGKALPEWLAEKKKRMMKAKKLTGRHHLELIQDFDMPGVSTNVQVTPDGNYILATGIYKPRIRCYDVKNLSMKFERCFDSEVMKFIVLSEDYSKLVFLQCDRFVEFHVQYGRYFRLRIPKFGRDLAYHSPSCDLYVGGVSSEVYRLNLELGRFNTPIQTETSTVNVCKINPVHHLVTLGTIDGKVEAYDPRSSRKCGTLDVALHLPNGTGTTAVPQITSLAFKDGLKFGVGSSSGQVLLYDIRASRPLLVKDHWNSEPIIDIDFQKEEEMVFSMDKKVIKIWHESDGSPFTAIEGGDTDFNDLCVVPHTGMFFAANEDRKILSYYVPTLGPAPRWCAFLDNITEELEENEQSTIYDDYKFVTEQDLHELGLEHLIGTSLLRGYMHGYFMDMRLYRKAKSIVQPFQFEEYKKKKIREKIAESRKDRLKLNKLPQVNKELALKIMSEPVAVKNKKAGNLLEDDRFKGLFENPDFQIDKSTEEFRLLNPVISGLEKARTKKLEQIFESVELGEDQEGRSSGDESSSDDEKGWLEEVRKERRLIKDEERAKQRMQDAEAALQPKFYEIKSGEKFQFGDLHKGSDKKRHKLSLEERVTNDVPENITSKGPLGGREMTFAVRTRKSNIANARDKAMQHREERKKLRRSAGSLKNKKNSWKR